MSYWLKIVIFDIHCDTYNYNVAFRVNSLTKMFVWCYWCIAKLEWRDGRKDLMKKTVLTEFTTATDRQTDRRTDRQNGDNITLLHAIRRAIKTLGNTTTNHTQLIQHQTNETQQQSYNWLELQHRAVKTVNISYKLNIKYYTVSILYYESNIILTKYKK